MLPAILVQPKQQPQLQLNNQRLCLIQNHENRPLQILCIEDNCKKNRLCCAHCYFRNHQCHKAIHLAQKSNNSRLEFFKIHADKPDSKGFEYFSKLLQDINQVYRQTIQEMTKKFKKCYKKIKQQYLVIANTFRKDLHNTVLNQLLDVSKQQHYVNMLKFLQKIPNLENVQELKKRGVNISHQIINHMKKLKIQLNSILLQAQQELVKVSFSQEKTQLQNHQAQYQFNNVDNADIDDKGAKDSDEHIQIGNKFQKKMIVSEKMKKNHKKIKKQLNKQEKKHSIQQKRRLIKNKDTQMLTNNDNLIVRRMIEVQQKKQKQQINQVMNTYNDSVLDISSSESKSTNLKIQKNLFDKSLSIHNDVTSNISQSQVLSIIQKEKDLQILNINWCSRFSPQTVNTILQNLPKLKYINLGFCPIEKNVLDILVHKFPNIRQFNYGLDYERDYCKFFTDYHFFNPEIYDPFQNTNLKEIRKLTILTNIWISNCQADQSSQIVNQLKQLTKITLGKCGKQQILTMKLVAQLQLKTNLTTLALQSLIIQQNGLKNVLQNNKHLSTIVINGCSGITDNTITAIRESCQYLTILHLYALSNIQGKEICQIKSLKYLTIMTCPKIDGKGLKNLTNLQLLDISFYKYQYWVKDKLMQEIKQLKKLKALNFHNTPITGRGILKLKYLKLEVLNCGRTSIKPEHLFEFFQTNNFIKKLCLQGLNENNKTGKITSEDVLKIIKLLPNLTHLNIRDCNVDMGVNLIGKLKNLKCLTISQQNLTEKQQSQLLQAGVAVNFES